MKQLIQSYKTGELGLFEVPAPICRKNGILIETTASLVSAGTEKMIIEFAKKSVVGKAKERPDLVKHVMSRMQQEGIKNTLGKVFNKLDTPIPLGYSCAGKVIEIGESVSGVSIGDRVACGGAGYANHSEINYIPNNLFLKIPENIDDIDASFVTVGAIALQGIRQAEPLLGEKIVVIGLGLIGQLTVQLLKANGSRVLGVDIESDKLSLAKRLGADRICKANEVIDTSKEFSNGYGVDKVIITASTSSNQPIIDAGEIARLKGRVVVVGLVGMNIPRNIYYKKELDVRLSMSYGPGRYDPDYEEKGIDYPYAYVRWTEQRNFEAFLNLISGSKITPKELITHKYDFCDSLKAYDLLEGKIKERYLAIILTYKNDIDLSENKIIQISKKAIKSDKLNIGLVGAGNFTKSIVLPNLKKIEGIDFAGLCTATGVSSHSIGNKYGFKYVTTDDDEIFKNNAINAVIVTTRHNDHASKVLKAIEYRKHIFVEKPLCITEADLEEIKEAYEGSEKKLILQVGFNRRFSPFIQKMKEILKDRPISIIYTINAGVIARDIWIQDKEIGGGRIIGEVCHFIDTVSFLAESYPSYVFATCVRKSDQSIPDEDNINVIINFENGSTASINYFAFGNKKMPKEHIEVFANGIALIMDDFRRLAIFKSGNKKRFKSANQDKGFRAEFEAFKNAVKFGVPSIEFESIYKTTKTTFKIIESIKNRKSVKIG